MRKLLALMLVAIGSLQPVARASVSLTFGTGSAVTTVDRQATFDSLTTSFIDLSNYSEGGLSITVPDFTAVGFDAFNEGSATMFHYGSGGNNSYVTIRGTDSAVFGGLEFKLGDGYGQANTLFAFETYLNGMLTGAGNSITVAKGTVVGFSDPNGFDELRIGAKNVGAVTYNLGDFQAIAIDNVRVELADTNGVVPEPFSVAVWGGLASVGGVVALRQRQR